MSEIMMGVLSMPDDMFWADDPVSRYQHNQIRLKAAQRIRALEAALSAKLPERLTRDQAEPICSLTCVEPCCGDCDCNSEVQEAWAVLRERLGG